MNRRVLIKISNDKDSAYGKTAESESGVTLRGLGKTVSYPTWGIQIECSNLTAGSTKDVVVRTSSPDGLFVTVQAEPVGSVQPIEMTAELASQGQDAIGAADKYNGEGKEAEAAAAAAAAATATVQVQLNRLEFIDMIDTTCNLMAIHNDDEARACVAQFASKLDQQLKAAGANADPQTVGLKADVMGQVAQAVSRRDWFTKWGRHYLPSLAQAHRLQQCNNFKDPGVQFYGGKLFNEIRDGCDSIFMKLPPPTPTGHGNPHYRGGATGGGGTTKGLRGRGSANMFRAARVPTMDMSRYYDRNCGCFHGEATAALSDGSKIKVQDLRRGMRVRVDRSNPKATGTVACVVETKIGDPRNAPLTALPGGCVLTPYHPVRIEGEWKFPIDIAGAVTKPGLIECHSVFSFVMEDRSGTILINNDECITLGHDLTGPVAGHQYFGSEAVLKDLRKCKGFNKGHVVFQSNPLLRDKKTGLLTKYDLSREVAAVAVAV